MKTAWKIFSMLLLIRHFLFAGSNTSNINGTMVNQFNNIVLPFIKNQGQCDKAVKYYVRTFGGNVFVTKKGEIVYSLPKKISRSRLNESCDYGKSGVVLRETFVNGHINIIEGEQKNSGKFNSFKGRDPVKWENNISTFENVYLPNVYKGIDIKLKAYGNNIEKLFYINPGYDPQNIKVKIDGATALKTNSNRELEVVTEQGIITFTSPFAYQGNREIRVDYEVENNVYSFKVGNYDKEETLVIDPLLASTFVGGENIDDSYEPSIALDNNGYVFVSGYTHSTDFPTTVGSFDESFNGGSTDRFITKFNGNLSELIASTFIGGTGAEVGMGLCIDKNNNVYIAGYTASSDYPTTSGAYDENSNGNQDVYISKFDNNLSQLIASTYLGGSGNEGETWPRIDLTLDQNGNVLIAGLTRSQNFPTSINAYDSIFNGGAYGGDPFITKFDSNLSTLLSSTYLGGSRDEWRVSILVDNESNIFICGETESSDYPVTPDAYDPSFNGWSDIFISKLNADLTKLSASTLFGENNAEEALAMRINDNGDVYISGYTKSSNFPTTAGAYDRTFNGGDRDAYISKFDNKLSILKSSTFLGGNNREDCRDIIIDKSNNLYVTGNTTSLNFPISDNAYDKTFNGSSPDADIFITKIDSNLSLLLKSTYVGDDFDDVAYGMCINNKGDLYVCGITNSSDFPTTSGAFDNTYNGYSDCFVIKIDSTLSNNISSIDKTESIYKEDYVLFQNYPNPFNPSTTIGYEISKFGNVELRILDILGKEVITLLNKEQYPGKYNVNLNFDSLPSGAYFYQLRFNGNVLSKKMILMK